LAHRRYVAPFPPLQQRAVREGDPCQQVARYETERGVVEVVCEYHDGAWGLRSFRWR
jgi:hypothetical protein